MALVNDLEGMKVLVTGGGSGIGPCVAVAAQDRGAAVAVLDLAKAPENSVAVRTDVTDDESVAQAVAQAAQTMGGIDAVHGYRARGGWRHGRLASSPASVTGGDDRATCVERGSHMAGDIFMRVDDIKGESSDAKHKDEIDVLAWSWGLSQSGTTHLGGGGGTGKVSVQDLSLTKFLDAASPLIVLSCCEGRHHKEAVLSVRKAAKQAREFLKITMKDVLVTSVSLGGSQGDDRPTENVTFNFGEVTIEYTPQDPSGKAGTPISATWNVVKNA